MLGSRRQRHFFDINTHPGLWTMTKLLMDPNLNEYDTNNDPQYYPDGITRHHYFFLAMMTLDVNSTRLAGVLRVQ